ncbi:ATP-dependent helicase HrpB [Thiothrix unzii]|jgi:ATP-dependent helicase HrpB|uniref:ATP-dependent helicase HrpB n=1 Tax=Thiothrix unzii TaxID=111769 RepID=UPI002A36B5BA|nr:ATP-dependent helicase HrpB [Thiothrix unzii]MDX9988072.1 ATP-dependent helicase HrpB [Thiothrix unzii]
MKTPFAEQILPIDAVLDDLKQALRERHEVVLEAPPGAGKTTRVPLALLDEAWLAGNKILMLEPRRIAARSSAHRMASLLGESVGQTVGYRMRLDHKISRQTRIEVITEGILTRQLQQDPSLDGVGLVIFDEFHERNLDSDLALSLCLKGRELFRDDSNPLKLLVMSATLDSVAIASLLDDAPVVRSEGRTYPVNIRYGQAAKPNERIVERMVATLRQALSDNPDSSILAFLPGQGEIHRTTEALGEWLVERRIRGVHLRPMYGNLTLDEQQQAIAPLANPDERKVVLATNIAETSLTIEGVDVVVDSGLVREARFDPGTGMTGLHTTRISRASSTQRAGRAGRLAPGVCYRLWTESQQEQLAAHNTPEILRADLAPLALQLLQWGMDDPTELRWLDVPPSGLWQQALDLLETLGAIERKGKATVLTAHGQVMCNLPVHPRLAHLLICGAQAGHLNAAANLASLLSERNPFSQDNPDISHPLEILAGKTKCPHQQQGWLQRTRQLANQFVEQVRSQTLPESGVSFLLPATQIHGYLLACAYPDRIARRRHSGGYQLANGRSADLPDKHALGNQAWLAIAEVSSMVGKSSDTIRSAAALDDKLFASALADQVREQTVVEWDNKAGRFIAEAQHKIGALVLQRKALQAVPGEAKSTALIGFIRKQGLDILPWQVEQEQWCARINLLRGVEPERAWPDVSRANLLTTLEDWLAPYLNAVNVLGDFKKLDLTTILSSLLPWDMQQRLEQLAPKSLEVPSGHSIAIDYSQSPPILAVKLQEMFGCQQTPTIANGRVALLVHLLSPAGRPLQITQDLAGFWRTSYHEVKKDMKGRYPKHPWPDDPLQAIATRKVKRLM